MYKWLIFTLFSCVCFLENEAFVIFDEDAVNPTKFGPKVRVPVSIGRCAQRFSPGKCMEPVTSVWTFVAQIQNCTERLGCRLPTRTNRFSSYHRCMRNCRAYILTAKDLSAPAAQDSRSDHWTSLMWPPVNNLIFPPPDVSNPRRGPDQPNLPTGEFDRRRTQHNRASYYKFLVNGDGKAVTVDDGYDVEYGGDEASPAGRDHEEMEEMDQFRPPLIDEVDAFM